MKILIITPIIYSNNNPFNHILKSILEGFLNSGYEILRYVAISQDNDEGYKLGIENKNMKYKSFKRREYNKSNFIMRFISDCWTNFRMAIRILQEHNIDLLFEDTSYSSIFPVLIANMKHINVVMMVQDVWPDNAVMSGMLRENLGYKVFNWIQNICYKIADRIIVISEDIKDFLVSKEIDKDKIDVIYNWSYTDGIIDIQWEKNRFVQKFNLSPEIFYAVYAGNIGRLQNVEVIVEAAKLLQHDKGIQILIVGEGVRREAIEQKIIEYGLENLKVFHIQSPDMALHIYSMAGVNIIPLVEGGIKTAMPSKTAICLSCCKPIIACVGKDSKFAKLITDECIGMVKESNDFASLADAISFYRNRNITSKKDIINFYMQHFIRSENVEKYVRIVGGYQKC